MLASFLNISRKALLLLVLPLLLAGCGYESQLLDRSGREILPVQVSEQEGIAAPSVVFLDGFGNEINIESEADIAGSYVRLIREPGIEEFWQMQYRFRRRREGSLLWEEWGEWQNYDDTNRPRIGEEGEYEMQVRYADPNSDPDAPPLLSLTDEQLGRPAFLYVEPVGRPGRYIRDGEIVAADVQATLPDKRYTTIEGNLLTPQIWIMKESTGTIYKSSDVIRLEVLEGYVNTYQARVLYLDAGGDINSESPILTFTIDKQRPGKPIVTKIGFVDDNGFTIPPNSRTNSDALLTVQHEQGEEELVLQYYTALPNASWADMEMVGRMTGIARFSVPENSELNLKSLRLRYRDAAGNTSVPSDEFVYNEGIVIDRITPSAPPWSLAADGNTVVDLVNSTVTLTARLPKSELSGSFEFSYDSNIDGTFTAWQKLPIGSGFDFTGTDGRVTPFQVRIRFTDAAGNMSSVLEKSFTIDRARPEAPDWELLDSNGNSVHHNRRLTLPAFLSPVPPESETDGLFQYRFSIDAVEAFSPWSTIEEGETVEFSGEENQTLHYDVEIRYLDRAGNSSPVLSRSFVIDRKIPDAPAWELVTEEGFEVGNSSFTSSDVLLYPTRPEGEKIGIFEYRYRTGEKPMPEEWTPLSGGDSVLFTAEQYAEQHFSIEIRFRDEVNNVSESSIRTFTIDKLPPKAPFWNLVRYTYGVQVDSQEDTIHGPVRLYATIPPDERGGGVFEYHLQIREDPYFPWTELPSGYYTSFEGAYQESVEYTVEIRYRDEAGNVSPIRKKTFFVDRDIPAPPIWLLEDSEGVEVFEDRVMNLPAILTAADPVDESGGTYEYSYTLDDKSYSDWIPLPVGEAREFDGIEDENVRYTIRIRYVDRTGNSSPVVSRSFFIDYERPAAPVWDIVDEAGLKVTNGQVVTGKAVLTATDPSYETGGVFQYAFDDNRDGLFSDWEAMEIGETTTFLGKDDDKVWIDLKIRYIDRTGNPGAEDAIQFKIDRNPASETSE